MHSNECEKYLKTSGKTSNSDISSSDTSEQASEDASEPKQITLSAAFKRAAPLPSNSPRYSLLHATMNFVFQTLQPLSIEDEPAFCNLLQVAERKFQLPHCTFITSKVLPEAYSEV